MTDAEILEVARREINKGIEGARAKGVVCGPILRLSVRPCATAPSDGQL